MLIESVLICGRLSSRNLGMIQMMLAKMMKATNAITKVAIQYHHTVVRIMLIR